MIDLNKMNIIHILLQPERNDTVKLKKKKKTVKRKKKTIKMYKRNKLYIKTKTEKSLRVQSIVQY